MRFVFQDNLFAIIKNADWSIFKTLYTLICNITCDLLYKNEEPCDIFVYLVVNAFIFIVVFKTV